MAFAGHPLVGDSVYGRRAGRGRRWRRFPRQALHAASLGFVHPVSGAAMRFESPLPDDLAALVAALRRSNEAGAFNEV